MSFEKIDAEIDSVNLKLKADLHPVTIQRRGQRLSLVATLPPKQNSLKQRYHQQRISLKLRANSKGLRRAHKFAIVLSDDLDRDKFNWADWIALDAETAPDDINTCGYWIEQFRQHIWDSLTGNKEIRWKKQWLYFGLNRLPSDTPLTPDTIITAALTKSLEHKAARDRACYQLQRFADFAGVSVDLSPLRAGYSSNDVERIPLEDIQIVKTIDAIPDPRWRYVFALMATYGLRDHEAFLCTLEDRDGVLVASVPKNTKTGAHVAYPVPANWIDRWLMEDRTLPRVKAVNNDVYGSESSKYWRSLNAPGTPYSLRHAYSIRCHLKKVSPPIIAGWMGHTVQTNQSTYQKWIADTTNKAAWEKLQEENI